MSGPDPRPGHYYVSVIDPETGRRGLLAGPWSTHAESLAKVDDVRRIACDLDPRAHWYAFGTARYAPDLDPVPGVLNDRL